MTAETPFPHRFPLPGHRASGVPSDRPEPNRTGPAIGSLKNLRCRLPECPASRRGRSRWYRDLVAEIAEEVLEDRRNRINPRVIKRKMSNWRKKRPEHRNYTQPAKEFGDAIVMRR